MSTSIELTEFQELLKWEKFIDLNGISKAINKDKCNNNFLSGAKVLVKLAIISNNSYSKLIGELEGGSVN